jgi:hypothetical protein
MRYILSKQATLPAWRSVPIPTDAEVSVMTAHQAGHPETMLAARLEALMRRFGGWEITRQPSAGVWAATTSPAPAQVEMHCAYTLDELEAKLEHAEAQRREALGRQVLAGQLDDVPWYVTRR